MSYSIIPDLVIAASLVEGTEKRWIGHHFAYDLLGGKCTAPARITS